MAVVTLDLSSPELLEALSDQQHEIWSHWMRYQRTKGHATDQGFVLDTDSMERWNRQMETSYPDLTEREKDSDREQARKILSVLAVMALRQSR